MSGRPDDIPKFVDELMRSSGLKMNEPPAQSETHDCRPKSEVAATTTSQGQGRLSIDTRPRTDIPRASNAIQPSPDPCCRPSDQLAAKKESVNPADIWFVSYLVAIKGSARM